MADVCHFEGEDIFQEQYSWVVSLAVVYFRVQFVTRDLFSSIAFVYLFEAFYLAMNILYHYAQEHEQHSAVIMWCANNILSLFSTSNDKSFMCYESAMIALIAAPLVAIGAAVLWYLGAERLVGVSYRTSSSTVQHAVLWPTFLVAVMLGQSAIFAPVSDPHDIVHRKHTHIRAGDPNTTVLFVSVLGVTLSALIPLQAARDYGFRSKNAWRAARAYVVYSIMSIFIAFFSEFFRPSVVGSIGFRSSYSRVLVSLATLYFCCVFFWLARIAYNKCWLGWRRRRRGLFDSLHSRCS